MELTLLLGAEWHYGRGVLLRALAPPLAAAPAAAWCFVRVAKTQSILTPMAELQLKFAALPFQHQTDRVQIDEARRTCGTRKGERAHLAAFSSCPFFFFALISRYLIYFYDVVLP